MSAFGGNYHKNDLVDYIEMFFKKGGTIEDMFDVLKYVFEFGNTPIDNLQQELTKEKERNKKAIEYIKSNSNIYLNIIGNKVGFFNENDGYTPIELLEILEDKEKKDDK